MYRRVIRLTNKNSAEDGGERMISIRPMAEKDLPIVQELLSQLGYPLDGEEVRRRYAAVAGSGDNALVVAEQTGHVIALCHMYARPALDKPPEAIVQALVVDRASRAHGVGKVMMTAAEAWARDRGFMSVALASSVARTDAHAFYEAIGYQRAATSHLFRKALS
jgi:GNAT superfamily N-acetyltransferase